MDLAKINYSKASQSDQVHSDYTSVKSKTNSDTDLTETDFRGFITSSNDGKEISDVENSHIDMEIDKLNKKIENSGRSLSYRMHEDSKTIIVKIKNTVTGETIKEYPNEKNLDFITKLMEQSGLIFDEKQ